MLLLSPVLSRAMLLLRPTVLLSPTVLFRPTILLIPMLVLSPVRCLSPAPHVRWSQLIRAGRSRRPAAAPPSRRVVDVSAAAVEFCRIRIGCPIAGLCQVVMGMVEHGAPDATIAGNRR